MAEEGSAQSVDRSRTITLLLGLDRRRGPGIQMKISVVGLGKLGAPLAAVLASKGFRVVGTDVNPAFIAAVNAGKAPVDEPRLQELIDENRARLHATADAATAVAETDATFIIVPTPSDASGRFSNQFVLAALESVGEGVRRKSGYQLVEITSTVRPGSTGGRSPRA